LSDQFTNVRGQLVTLHELSNLFAVAPETIRNWVGKGCPALRKSDGKKGGQGWKFATADVIEWRMTQTRREAPKEHVDIDEAKRRKLAAEAELAEIDAAVKRGELAPISEVAAEFAGMVTAARAKMFSIPTKLAPILASMDQSVEIQAVLDAAMREVVDELAGNGEGEGTDAETAGGIVGDVSHTHEAAAETPGFGVGG
jgi:phage terminase Nu1 subunit (DNA packaging protein)